MHCERYSKIWNLDNLFKNDVVYEFSCPLRNCISNVNNRKSLNFYIGYTCTTFSRRLMCPLPKQCNSCTYRSAHQEPPKYNYQQILLLYTKILYSIHCIERFNILECKINLYWINYLLPQVILFWSMCKIITCVRKGLYDAFFLEQSRSL